MTDPMDEIRQLLKNSPIPEINKYVENQTIDKAMAAFEQKNLHRAQGIAMWRRLINTARSLLNPNNGAVMKKSYMLAGGLCSATLVVALLNTSALNNEFIRFKQESQDVVAQIKAAPLNPSLSTTTVELEESREQSVTSADAVMKKVLPIDSAQRAAPAALMASPPMDGAPMPSKVQVGIGRDRSADGVNANMVMMPDEPIAQPAYHDEGRDKFEHVKDNPLKIVKEEPVSTFSIDVDTASYSFMRASLNNNVLPQKDSVRIEEMVNYFPYDYALPKEKNEPFASSVSVMPTPWNKGTKLIHIGIKGYELPNNAKPHSNLVFLIDTSGSMNEPNKLPLLKNSMKLLLDSLQADDTVAIVTYAGSAGVALEPTKVADKAKILSTIDSFNSGGSTAGAEGIRQAYQLAERNFDKKGVNRVILATDGDFNIGITDQNELKSFIERKRDTGVFLSVLGFGQGNYNDAMMQTLAQNGNGNAAYIDNLNEARKVLVEEAGSTLFTIAKDVKIQVEFNPTKVAEYRLIGYETRMLNREDFNNDKIDAGEIGAGHAVTAIYEITPTDSDARLVDDLRYAADKKVVKTKGKGNEYAFLKIRYKLPKEDVSKLITTPIDGTVEVTNIDKASTEARFATSVAAFGQLLRGEGMTKDYTYDDVVNLAESAKGTDKFGYRAEFINLVRLAKSAAGLKPLEGGQR
ncbi:MAG: VWA domain-containing protein [Rickettsiales bacterium]|nr:VWA domain-containing protein [Rickettsiales bacterium]